MAKKQNWQRGQKTPPHPRGWLWWTAVFALVLGGLIAYIFSLENTYQADAYMKTSIMVSVVIAGICVISALSDRFF